MLRKIYFIKASFTRPGVRPGASWQLVAGRPGRFVKEFEWVHIFPAMIRTRPCLGRFGKYDYGLSRLCYGLGWYISGVAPVALQHDPVRPG